MKISKLLSKAGKNVVVTKGDNAAGEVSAEVAAKLAKQLKKLKKLGKGLVGARRKKASEAAKKLGELARSKFKGPSNAKVEKYETLKKDTSTPGQAHHLNQDAAYRDVIPRNEGMSVKLEGNAFTQPGTPHYEAHSSMEKFWDQYRKGGDKFGEKPTNIEYSKALNESLQAAGFTKQEALDITRQAARQRVQSGILGGEPVPRIPGRINQVK